MKELNISFQQSDGNHPSNLYDMQLRRKNRMNGIFWSDFTEYISFWLSHQFAKTVLTITLAFANSAIWNIWVFTIYVGGSIYFVKAFLIIAKIAVLLNHCKGICLNNYEFKDVWCETKTVLCLSLKMLKLKIIGKSTTYFS